MKSQNLSKRLEKYASINKNLKRTIKRSPKKLLTLSSLAFAGIPVAEATPVYVDFTTNSYLPLSVSNPSAAGGNWIGKKLLKQKFSGFYADGQLAVVFRYRDIPNRKIRQMGIGMGAYTELVGAGGGYYSSQRMVSKLNANTNIGSGMPFQAYNSSNQLLLSAYKNSVTTSATYSYDYGTAWNNMNNEVAYVGFRFKPTGSSSPWHYGFLKLEITNSSAVANKRLAIVGYGYESSPGVSINPSIVLPVELLTFRAIAKQTAVRLEWATASEENNAGFEVQRSTDGKNFETLAFVEGNGTTIEQQEYFYDDKALRSGQYYYRLKQIDFNGRFEYSEVTSAVLEERGQIIAAEFYPNPTHGLVQLDYSADKATDLTISIFNATGQLLVNETTAVDAGENNLNFDLSNLPKGNYFVKLQSGENTQYQKLVIQ